MLEETIRSGVASALAGSPEAAQASAVAHAVCQSAVTSAQAGSHVVVIRQDTDSAVRYDVIKAVLAAAAILGSAVPVIVGGSTGASPPTFAAAMSAIGALRALQGVDRALPKGCAHILLLLVEDREVGIGGLRKRLGERWGRGGASFGREFEHDLETLQEMGLVRVRNDIVKLSEYVIVR